jgi:nucleoside-diphosphate-sugar epimerase
MKRSIFITGASGFIGKSLLRALDWQAYRYVYCLSRDPEKMDFPDKKPGNLIVVKGDLLDVDSYRENLKQVDTVVHLAAVTGKVRPAEYYRVNTLGTRKLVECCQQSGVRFILYVSSIAAKFKKKKRYFYADSKIQAEEIIRSCGLKYSLLRPTMVLGKESPVFSGFSRFAFLPLVPLFGRGEVKIQPVFVDDVAEVISNILKHSRFDNRMVEIGGPERISIRNFLELIRQTKQKKKTRFVRIPMGPAVFLLTLAEPLFYPLLPLTLGQLATFRNEGAADENELFLKLSPGFTTVSGMVSESLIPGKENPVRFGLDRECRVFCRYLIRQPANRMLLDKYAECHEKVNLIARNRFDSFLLKQASRNRFFAKLSDSYSRFFYPDAVLRKKLVYLLAILETSSPYFRFFDQAPGRNKVMVFLTLGLRGSGFALALLLSFFMYLPFRVMMGRKDIPAGVE